MISESHTTGHAVDTAFVAATGTSPFWWNDFDNTAHIIIFLCAVIVGILRVLILLREYKNTKQKEIQNDDE